MKSPGDSYQGEKMLAEWMNMDEWMNEWMMNGFGWIN